MTDVLEREEAGASEGAAPAAPVEKVVKLDRRTIDRVLIGLGIVVTAVLAIAGALLTWGSSFAENYVRDELVAQNISFPPAENLLAEGRDDLAQYGGQLVDSGAKAEAYASFIQGHVANVADGATYAELGGPERAARAAVQEAQAAGASAAEIAELQEAADTITGQRETIFKGEMLRGTLLNTYAWSTIGQIAGIAAIAAFIGSALMAVLVVAGLVHMRRMRA